MAIPSQKPRQTRSRLTGRKKHVKQATRRRGPVAHHLKLPSVSPQSIIGSAFRDADH